jgi:capsular exopolysaccharide synthesis family protein
LKKLLEQQKQDAISADKDAVQYNGVRTEIATKRALLDALIKRQAETQVLSHLRGEHVSNIRIVDRALAPSRPFRPSYARNAAIALLLGGGLGIGLAFARSSLDRSLRTSEQVEQYLRLPPLGIIPAARSLAPTRSYRNSLPAVARRRLPEPAEEIAIELFPHNHSRSSVAEAYRAFMAALVLSRPGGLKSFVITSALPKEGKTATAVNLAVVLGQLGKRVLLIDADLHKPRLHEVLRVGNRVGLVSVLTEGMDAGLAIVESVVPGVSLLPAGPEWPHPSSLLASEAMSRLLRRVGDEFDHVIIDTPPVFPLADLLVFGAQTDGVVLCVRGGKTPREQVARVRDKLVRANMRILGVVINDLSEEADAYAAYAAGDAAFESVGAGAALVEIGAADRDGGARPS